MFEKKSRHKSLYAMHLKKKKNSDGQIWPYFVYKVSNTKNLIVFVRNTLNRSQITFYWLKIYRRTSSYAMHFFTLFIFAKHAFSMPVNCLNCQSGLVISKIYQTEAKEPQIDWKYNGVRARTPCIFRHLNSCIKQLFCVYQLLKLSKWTCLIKNIPNRSQETSNWLKIHWRTSSYAGVRARTPCIFFTFFIFVKNSFSLLINCLYCQSGLVISKIYQRDVKEP